MRMRRREERKKRTEENINKRIQVPTSILGMIERREEMGKRRLGKKNRRREEYMYNSVII